MNRIGTMVAQDVMDRPYGIGQIIFGAEINGPQGFSGVDIVEGKDAFCGQIIQEAGNRRLRRKGGHGGGGG
jgi:hypothetical protein